MVDTAGIRIGPVVPDEMFFGASAVARLYYGHHLVYPPGILFVAEKGTFTLTGQVAIPFATRRMPLDVGAFTLSGKNVDFHVFMPAEPGSFVYTGIMADVLLQARIPAAAGSFTLAGQNADLRRQVITAEAGAFTLTGIDATIQATRKMPADVGAFTLSGQAATLLKNYPLVADAGSFTLSGQIANFIRTHIMPAAAGSFVLSGQNALLPVRMPADVGVYALSGQIANLTRQLRMNAEAGAFALSGKNATLRAPAILIDRTTGTNIGNMTANGGLAAAFDGVTNQAESATANSPSDTVGFWYVGKTFAVPTALESVTTFGSNDDGYENNATGNNITIQLYGKLGAAPANSTDGTLLGSITFADLANESAGRLITSSDTATYWDHAWVRVVQSSSRGVRIGELQMRGWIV